MTTTDPLTALREAMHRVVVNELPGVSSWQVGLANRLAVAARAALASEGEGLDVEEIKRLRRIAREAENTYVGRHWPSMADMRRDGIGHGLVEDAAHERFIRRYLDTFQPAFVSDLLARLRTASTEEPCRHRFQNGPGDPWQPCTLTAGHDKSHVWERTASTEDRT